MARIEGSADRPLAFQHGRRGAAWHQKRPDATDEVSGAEDESVIRTGGPSVLLATRRAVS